MLSLCMNRTMLLKQYNDKIKGNKPTPPPPKKNTRVELMRKFCE